MLRWQFGLVVALAAPLGCTPKDEGKPHPELKVPDIPPGRGAEGKSGALKK